MPSVPGLVMEDIIHIPGSSQGHGEGGSQVLSLFACGLFWEEGSRVVGHGWQGEESGAMELLRSLERQTESLTVSKNNQERVRFPRVSLSGKA